MKHGLLNYLACPTDGQSPLRLEGGPATHDDIEEGWLHCDKCAQQFPIVKGIPSFLLGQGKSDLNDGSAERVVEPSSEALKRQEIELRDQQAEDYDASRGYPEDFDAAIITEHLDVRFDDLILDAGSGTGCVSARLARQSCEVLSVDFSFESLVVQQRKLRTDPGPGAVHLIHADLDHLPIRSNICRTVISSNVLQHLPRLTTDPQAISEISRVMQGGGTFVLTIYNYTSLRKLALKVAPWLGEGEVYQKEGFHGGRLYYHRFTARELRGLLEDFFDLQQMSGIRSLPKGAIRKLGKWALPLEGFYQRIPFSRQTGFKLLAVCKKREGH